MTTVSRQLTPASRRTVSKHVLYLVILILIAIVVFQKDAAIRAEASISKRMNNLIAANLAARGLRRDYFLARLEIERLKAELKAARMQTQAEE